MKDSLPAAESWISREDDEEMATTLPLDLQDELMSEATKEGDRLKEEKSAEGGGEFEAGSSGNGHEGDVLSERPNTLVDSSRREGVAKNVFFPHTRKRKV